MADETSPTPQDVKDYLYRFRLSYSAPNIEAIILQLLDNGHLEGEPKIWQGQISNFFSNVLIILASQYLEKNRELDRKGGAVKHAQFVQERVISPSTRRIFGTPVQVPVAAWEEANQYAR